MKISSRSHSPPTVSLTGAQLDRDGRVQCGAVDQTGPHRSRASATHKEGVADAGEVLYRLTTVTYRNPKKKDIM